MHTLDRSGEREILEAITKETKARFLSPAVAAQALPYSGHARSKVRRQYLAGTILPHLEALELPAAHGVLDVVDSDLYAPGLDFALDQASLGGREGIIAPPWLWWEFYRLAGEGPLPQMSKNSG